MKLLADENIEWPLVKSIRETGYDILWVTECCASASDDAVLEFANEQGCVLVTNDTDFGTLVFHQQLAAHGVVLLRFANESVTEKIAAVRHLLAQHHEKLVGHFTVMTERQIRIRPLARVE